MLTGIERKIFYKLQTLRSLIGVLAVFILSSLFSLSTPWLLSALFLVLGVIVAGSALIRNFSAKKLFFGHGVAILVLILLEWLSNESILVLSQDSNYDFLVYRISSHIHLAVGLYLFGLIATWLFWKRAETPTVEAVVGGLAAIWLLSGHRNYHLDTPQLVSSLAWRLGVEPHQLLIGVGFIVTVFLGWYLVSASSRPIIGRSSLLRTYRAPAKGLLFFYPFALFAIFLSYAYLVHQQYIRELSRASNGVGQDAKEGESPLGFHSAVGKTKQPAALVRLEGDYQENPWQPMIYLREGALSSFNGRELVVGPPTVDTDVPRIVPGQPYLAVKQEEVAERKELVQSIYLLTKHKAVFAVDYPTSIRLIKNPDPQRFELTYQAKSAAPITRSAAFIGEEVGGENWDEKTFNYYLRAPGSLSTAAPGTVAEAPELDEHNEDLRYKALAKQLLPEPLTPVEKAFAITEFLSKESIYTRQPGHETATGADPVAPYLFSKEKRGYCVHFAHAAVFLLRLAGVPARIGTGYLTDLTYAKDGHILLHLGDRHAWPEVYVRGHGWVVFDVMPARAENEQALIPDEKLLEELMSKLDAAQELISPLPPEPESSDNKVDVIGTILRPQVIIPLLSLFIFIYLGLKSWLYYGYRLSNSPSARNYRSYLAIAARLSDLGYPRSYGETRPEYALRIAANNGLKTREVLELIDQTIFSQQVAGISKREVANAISQLNFPLWRRIFGFFSPTSLLRIIRP